jgi:hypothetical protein
MPRRKGKGRAPNRGREIPAIKLTRRDIKAEARALREANSVDPATDKPNVESDN